MSNGQSTAFLRDPVAFGKRHMLLIGSGLHSKTSAAAAPHADLTAEAHYLSVGTQIRVLYCNLKPAEHPARESVTGGAALARPTPVVAWPG